jgi:NAD(P)H dehydrogenase (quinone)
MTKILVTGATGGMGGTTLDLLLRKLPSRSVAAMARDPAKLADRAAAGIDVRRGDYLDYESLVRAFQDVETLFLVSAVAFSDRATQEANAVRAAKTAGVRRVVYTSLQKRPGSTFKISQGTDVNDRTEKALADSGMHFTILRNSLYMDVVPMLMGPKVLNSGIRLPPNTGRAALAKRNDLAEGAVAVLTQSGHENKTYTIGGSEAFSFADVASVLSRVAGRQVPLVSISAEEYVSEAIAGGLPRPYAEFALEWLAAIANGEFAEVTGDLERLTGRPPTSYRTFFEEFYTASSAA